MISLMTMPYFALDLCVEGTLDQVFYAWLPPIVKFSREHVVEKTQATCGSP